MDGNGELITDSISILVTRFLADALSLELLPGRGYKPPDQASNSDIMRKYILVAADFLRKNPDHPIAKLGAHQAKPGTGLGKAGVVHVRLDLDFVQEIQDLKEPSENISTFLKRLLTVAVASQGKLDADPAELQAIGFLAPA